MELIRERKVTRVSRAFLLATAIYLLAIPNAGAACGIDPACYVGKSTAKGATEEVTDALRKLLPEIMGQFDGAIRSGILTAEEAEKRVLQLASTLLGETLADAELRGDRLLERARSDALQIEQQTIKDVDRLLETATGLVRSALLIPDAKGAVQRLFHSRWSAPFQRSYRRPFGTLRKQRLCPADLGLDVFVLHFDQRSRWPNRSLTFSATRSMRLTHVKTPVSSMALIAS
jgi:hypothetical protein